MCQKLTQFQNVCRGGGSKILGFLAKISGLGPLPFIQVTKILCMSCKKLTLRAILRFFFFENANLDKQAMIHFVSTVEPRYNVNIN